MKTSKRILAVVIAVILAFSVFAVSAFAVDGSMIYKVVADSTNYAVGDTVTVNIYLQNDYNATCLRFPVLYSADVFELPATGVKLTAYDDCLTYKGSLEANTSNDESLYPLDYYDPSAYGCVLVQWTASVTSTNIGSFNSTESVKCFSFQLKVKSTAGGATGSIFIPEESNLFYNQAVIDSTDATTICRINTSFTFEGFDALGLWTPIKKASPFICLEPWNGLPADVDETTDAKSKKYAITIASGEEYTVAYTVEIIK